MAQTTFTGPVKSLNGFINAGNGGVVAFTTGSVTVADHAGRIISVGSDTDGKITLPAVSAAAAGASDSTGLNSGNNQGATFTFLLSADATDMDIKTNGTDKFIGQAFVANTNATVNTLSKTFVPAATNDVITLDGGTSGGKKGSIIRITAVDTSVYNVEATLVGGNTSDDVSTTPFADA